MLVQQFCKCLLLLWIINISGVLGEPISIGIGLLALGAYLFQPTIIQDVKNGLMEPCSESSIRKDLHSIEHELREKVHGQELAISYIHAALKNHLNSNHNSKALAISLHGLPGTGKNYVSDIIVKNIFPRYRKEGTSRFVHKFNSRIHFPDEKFVSTYQRQLHDWIISNVSACDKAFFIFDEVDKFPKGLLNVIKPFIDHHASFNRVSFRNAVFIFLSNAGGNDITQRFMKLREAGWLLSGKSRRDLNLNDFEQEIKVMAYNDLGGYKSSDVIGNNVIDHYIPFLPLEMEHVVKCIKTEYKDASQWNPGMSGKVSYDKLEEYVLSGMTFSPEPDNLFSTTGCKRVKSKVQTYLSRHYIYY